MLTFAAGFVDIVGYVALYKFLTAAMTGNTVRAALSLVQGHWSKAGFPISLIATFLAGSVLGRVVIEVGVRKRTPSVAFKALLIEAGLIAIVVVVGVRTTTESPPTWLLDLLAAAMGLQTATLTRVGPLTVHTTFVTGMLNKLAQLLSHGLFLTYDVWRGSSDDREARSNALRQARYMFAIWILYLTGSATGALAQAAVGMGSLAIPIVILCAAAAVDWLRPLSVQEERDQAETGRARLYG